MTDNNGTSGLEIAVIGMSGRFPGARNVHEFWENLKKGINSITFFSDEELLEISDMNSSLIKNSNFVKARGIIENATYFDAFFFDYSPIEAEILDPQVRIFYEICWEALEVAGCDPSTYTGQIGVYAGAAANRWWEVLGIMSGKNRIIGTFTADYLIDKDVLATRISYRLDLRGPAVTIHTACSTSLVAIDLACRALLTGQCDAALAGGVAVLAEKARGGGYYYEEGIIRSPDGYVRAFDARAKGVVFSDGAGVVLLKRLADAIADGDDIYAVIKGFSTNNDGRNKSSFTAPSVEGQAEVIRTALFMAAVEPESITYVETHGTATEIGDPIEVEALKLAFGTVKRKYCAIASVKTNIGHLDTAAGIASFIKAVLAIKYRQIPPSLNFESPNPKIDFDSSPFFVNTELREWRSNGCPLRAGVSSFGVGGTNAHIILEEAPKISMNGGCTSTSREYQLILLSARTAAALKEATQNFVNYLKENPHINLADAAFTLKVGRKAFEHRKILVCRDINEAIDILKSEQEESSSAGQKIQIHVSREEKRAVFMFPGQGSQYVDMARGLYETEAMFREIMDQCFNILSPIMGCDLKDTLYPYRPEPAEEAAHQVLTTDQARGDIDQTEAAQPVIFAVEYALAKLLMAWGIQPYAMIGHSIGEYTAACLAGVFTLKDALTLVAWRGKLMQQMPPGSMVSVPLSESELKPLLTEELALAAVNGPSQCVVSGSHEVIDAFSRQLAEKGIQTRKLHTSHAFHSKMMEPILRTFEEKVGQVSLNEPMIPFISNVTGRWITQQDARDPGYWARHLRVTVRFSDSLKELFKEKSSLFIEVGPGRTLSTFVRQHHDKKPEHMLVNLLRHPKEEVTDQYYLLNKIGLIWLYGTPIDWKGFYSQERRHHLSLPTYPFQRQAYWLEGDPFKIAAGGMPGVVPTKKSDISEWFYVPSWKRSVVSPAGKGETDGEHRGSVEHECLVFIGDDDNGFALRLVKRLTPGNKNRVTVVKMGDRFAREAEALYTLVPGREQDYEALVQELHRLNRIPCRIIYLWNLNRENQQGGGYKYEYHEERVDRYLDLGFYSLIYLTQTLVREKIDKEVQVTVVTNRIQEVTEDGVLYPEGAVILGPVMIIPQEYPSIKCCCIDIMLPAPGTSKEERLIEQLIREFNGAIRNSVIAYRGNHRLVRTFEPVPLIQSEMVAPMIRDRGVYWLTGGLGGIGLVLARHLASTVKAKLILTSRSPFPAREEWDQWLSRSENQNSISQKILKIKELESLGAEVRVFSVDVTDRQGMQRVVKEVKEQFGTINGVIHAAGVPGGGVIQLKTREIAEKVLAPKVKGTLVLNKVLEGIDLDFFVLCSSINSVLPIFGQVDYCAANAFMDAFAYYKNAIDGECTYTVSINWDAWQEVGMAAAAAKQFAVNKSETWSQEIPFPHPLLDRYRVASPQGAAEHKEYTFSSLFSISRVWVLSGHMTRQGKGLLPGVTYLEMACAAFENQSGRKNGFIEIQDVSFLNPLIVDKDEEREVRTILKNNDQGFEFLIQSRISTAEDRWQDHAAGRISLAPGREQQEEPKKHDIKGIKAKCNLEELDIAARREERSDKSLVIFGPRWKNVKTVKLGKKQGLALIELPEAFVAELEDYKLYPAMLDNAAAFLYGYINISERPYIPYAYKKLKISGTFPAKMYSYSQLVEEEGGGQSSREFLRFNVTIMDEEGRELVDIEEFTMLEISEDILARLREKESADSLGFMDKADGEESMVKDGILSTEGIEAFTRILAGSLAQVVVSTRDLNPRLDRVLRPAAVPLSETFQDFRFTGPLHSRPDISSPYVAPGTDIEQQLAALWQELLGIDQVGVVDDFFELGGDSLKATVMISRLKKELNADISIREIFNTPRIKDLSKSLEKTEDIEHAYMAIEPVEEREYYPLSPMQERLYILNEMEGISTAYNLPTVFIVEGKLDKPRLEQAIQLLIKRRQSLRTFFEIVNLQPSQFIRAQRDVDFRLLYNDLAGAKNAEAEMENWLRRFVRPFDLREAPLLRVGLARLSEEKNGLIFDLHHIVSDGMSILMMTRELMLLYDGRELPEVRLHYRDFSHWQNSEPGKAVIKKQEEFWLKQFKTNGGLPVLDIYTDYPRPPVQSFSGEMNRLVYDRVFSRRLNQLMKDTGTTLFMILLAAFSITLSKYSGQEDIVVGSVVSGREHPDTQDILGVFINALALRNRPSAEKTFAEFLSEVKENTLRAYENQGYPIGKLIEKLGAARDISRNPLYDAELIVQNMEIPTMDIKELKFTPYLFDAKTALVDIFLEVWQAGEEIILELRYCTKLFKRETMNKFLELFKEILTAALNNREIKLKDIKISHELKEAAANAVQAEEIKFGF